ncbi:hypothetical protein A1O3_09932 [Capronia epimyces CBS 606.96]|uniref:Nicotinamide-nucleotide adenylyltransferase n=1 Tax=Capronia epimyces CBS 606.96 TaxID=1182542 RepID=W9XBU4_9EURO|nr:uncharacterized protein A1O3_09932 [Capronia epimyces CBS 606.96]EXJ77703.1 hypothetical protein A1O3_09932 [Capronia epimyces CBS 606.96]
MQALQTLRSQFSLVLTDFAESSSRFRILHTIPPSQPPSSQALRTVFVLDSSFNPPSRAHMSLVKTALTAKHLQTSSTSNSHSHSTPRASADADADVSAEPTPRVLFLLATVNADKKPKPADFEDRLVMMVLMAEQLRAAFGDAAGSTSNTNTDPAAGNTRAPVVDIGITKEPYFIDKASCIDQSNVYRPEEDGSFVEQIHLTGFDTLIRIFTPKYYPNHTPPLSALAPFLSRHRLRATVRVETDSPSPNLKDAQGEPGSEFDTVEGQVAYVDRIARGDMEAQGLKREWATKVELVIDDSGEAQGVSSTRVRDAARAARFDEVEMLVGKRVTEWIKQRGLYRD